MQPVPVDDLFTRCCTECGIIWASTDPNNRHETSRICPDCVARQPLLNHEGPQ